MSLSDFPTALKFSKWAFFFQKYLCHYIPPFQLETLKSQPQMRGSGTSNSALLHCNKTKTVQRQIFVAQGA